MDRSRDFEALLSEVADKPGPMVALARLLGGGERRTLAVELCLRAVELAPGDEEIRIAAAEILASGVPPWHFDIVRDHGRNGAYQAALRRVVTRGCKVLEIGTGTGLLAMMAARAGASQVITCEADPAIAAVARQIIARNGFGDRIRVVGKHSTSLEVEGDLGGPVDVLVSEIVSNDLLSEGALPVMEHVREAGLLRPGGLMVPMRGRVRIALASDDEWQAERMSEAAGFDLTPFNRLAAPQRAIYVGGSRLTLRSEPADLFVFDFAGGGPYPEQQAGVTLAALGGRVNGIAQWIALDLDAEGRYENLPEPGAVSSWMANFHPFERELQPQTGERFTVHGRHDRKSLRLWCG
jgi:predicted nicotinamide N-methyase